ncbi:glycosyl hydrolase family 28-related protein [Spirosoma terrae]|uniref:Rhamnogalacturonase A/B/Epimerase-like pectate lyase domain-containing protein n=1 Tax=Spirosoma terrae TaxID=1968276 RepID=A0A6L9L422_9BACT|nr:glycosyl hydrolase family 28-related protein [Spirosoma terrae]NDU95276.1 hypothetical protein [Spirosoma terrae]
MHRIIIRLRPLVCLLFSSLILGLASLQAQVRVGLPTAPPDGSAALEVSGGPYTTGSEYRGIAPPKVALSKTSLASPITKPVTGLLVYNTANQNDVTPGYYYWEGSKWLRLTTDHPGSARVAAVNGQSIPAHLISQVSSLSATLPDIIYIADEGREGMFRYNSTSTVTPDGAMSLSITSGAGRYLRVYDGVVNVKWFGAKGDGTTNDIAALNAAINYTVTRSVGYMGHGNSGVVFLPRGVYSVAQRLVIPNKIRLLGEGPRVSEIRPTSSYSDSILVELSNKNFSPPGKINIFSTGIENISLHLLGKAGLIGVYSTEINEHAGLDHFLIGGVRYIGILIEPPGSNPGYGPQNFKITRGEIIFDTTEDANTRGIVIDANGGDLQALRDISIVGKNALGYGIELNRVSGFAISSIHVENLARGISIGEKGPVIAFSITGVNAQVKVLRTIYLSSNYDSFGYMLSAIRSTGDLTDFNGPVTYAVEDRKNQPTGKTTIPGPLGFYTVSTQVSPPTGGGARNIRCSDSLYDRVVLPTYADNAAATTGGVPVGYMYRTSDGTIKIRY